MDLVEEAAYADAFYERYQTDLALNATSSANTSPPRTTGTGGNGE